MRMGRAERPELAQISFFSISGEAVHAGGKAAGFGEVEVEIGGSGVLNAFAKGKAVRELPRLIKCYGMGRWRKRKYFLD